MKKLLTITTAAAGLAVLMAGPAMALPLNTSITVAVFNGAAAGSGTGSARQSEQALPSAATVLNSYGKRWSPFFGQAVKLGSPDEKDGPDDGQAEAVWG